MPTADVSTLMAEASDEEFETIVLFVFAIEAVIRATLLEKEELKVVTLKDNDALSLVYVF